MVLHLFSRLIFRHAQLIEKYPRKLRAAAEKEQFRQSGASTTDAARKMQGERPLCVAPVHDAGEKEVAPVQGEERSSPGAGGK
jgi:hypothetical protein